ELPPIPLCGAWQNVHPRLPWVVTDEPLPSERLCMPIVSPVTCPQAMLCATTNNATNITKIERFTACSHQPAWAARSNEIPECDCYTNRPRRCGHCCQFECPQVIETRPVPCPAGQSSTVTALGYRTLALRPTIHLPHRGALPSQSRCPWA